MMSCMNAARLGLLGALLACTAFAQDQCKQPPVSTDPPRDLLTDPRLLRRVSLALTGTTPLVSKHEALVAAPLDGRAAALWLVVCAVVGIVVAVAGAWGPTRPLRNRRRAPLSISSSSPFTAR